MKRDYELIRQIAFYIESASDEVNSVEIKIDGYEEDQIAYHCELMNEAGFLDCISVDDLGSKYSEFVILRLSSAGHDFADLARVDSIWGRAMERVKTTASGVSLQVLVAWLKEIASKGF
jgi:hypothetical protein